MDLTPCPVCHKLEIRGGLRVPCGCVDLRRLRPEFERRFFPTQPRKVVTELDRKQFKKVVGRCHHKKSNVAETMVQFKAEAGDCFRDFGNCWRRVRHPEITE